MLRTCSSFLAQLKLRPYREDPYEDPRSRLSLMEFLRPAQDYRAVVSEPTRTAVDKAMAVKEVRPTYAFVEDRNHAPAAGRRRRCSAARRICPGPPTRQPRWGGNGMDTQKHAARKQNVGVAASYDMLSDMRVSLSYIFTR